MHHRVKGTCDVTYTALSTTTFYLPKLLLETSTSFSSLKMIKNYNIFVVITEKKCYPGINIDSLM